MRKANDMSRCLTAFKQDSTIIAVVELGSKSWLVAGIVPGVERHPLKKLKPNEGALLALLYRWCEEARKAGHPIKRVCVAVEAGRDGFWLARWLRSDKIEAYVIHPTSVPVSREHRRAKTDRLDTGRLMRAFIGWLRGETDHCSMCAIPTFEEEDDKRPNREHQHLVGERTRIINRLKSCMARLGIRDFNPASRKAPERMPWFSYSLGYVVLASRRPTCLPTKCSCAPYVTGERCRVMPASPVRRTKAARNDERKASRELVTPECAAA
jgi:transposase